MKITEKQFAIASATSICGLLLIWVLPNTIALRHLLLLIGCFSAIGLIKKNWSQFMRINIYFLPLFFLLGLFIWVLIHLTFFSLNPELEVSELSGLWMRTFIGAIAGIGLAIALVKLSAVRKCFYVFLFSTPIINLLAYGYASYIKGALLSSDQFIWFLFTKIETAYFGCIAASIAVGNLIVLLKDPYWRNSQSSKFIFWLSGLLIVLLSAFIVGTKNGLAIVLGLCLLLVMTIIYNALKRFDKRKFLDLLIALSIICVLSLIWGQHKAQPNKGWGAILADFKVGVDIDGNKQWQKLEGSIPTPINEFGNNAISSTYSRTAWATVGVRLIGLYPLGYGSINSSFVGLLNEAKIEHENQGQTHSGWIDFGLAFGIPGLVLIFSIMLSIAYLGLKSRSSIALPWVIVCLALMPFGLIAEITWKQYFEATIFFLSLGATIVMLVSNPSRAPG